MKRSLALALMLLFGCGTQLPARNGSDPADAPPPEPTTTSPSQDPPAEAGPGPTTASATGIAAPTNPLVPDLTRVTLNGYVIPSFVVTSRSDTVPRDKLTIGMISSRSGLKLTGKPYQYFSYVIHVGFDAAVINNRVASATRVLTGSGGGDKNGDGIPDGVDTYAFVTSVPVEEATLTFSPVEWYRVSAGHQRIPFSVGAGTVITAQMFPTRPGPTEVFMTGPDDGLVNTFLFLKERIQARAGIFNGNSLGLQVPGTTTAGPVWSAFLDVHPLGKMPPREGDEIRGPLRVGLGVGVLYRLGTLYDDKGYQATSFRDIRLSTAVRAAFYGLFIQGEYLRRVQTDELSSRPSLATGAYVQGSFYFRVLPSIALAPIGRFGLTAQDQAFAPQTTTSLETGIAFYPRANLAEPDVIRLILEYLHETRTPSGEISNGGLLHMQMRW